MNLKKVDLGGTVLAEGQKRGLLSQLGTKQDFIKNWGIVEGRPTFRQGEVMAESRRLEREKECEQDRIDGGEQLLEPTDTTENQGPQECAVPPARRSSQSLESRLLSTQEKPKDDEYKGKTLTLRMT